MGREPGAGLMREQEGRAEDGHVECAERCKHAVSVCNDGAGAWGGVDKGAGGGRVGVFATSCALDVPASASARCSRASRTCGLVGAGVFATVCYFLRVERARFYYLLPAFY
jgi:hypothetical protein